MKTASKNNFIFSAIIFLAALIQLNSAAAATINLSDRPLFLGTSVEPNIFFTIDDSGSMDWEVLKSAGALTVHGTGTNSGNLDFTPDNNTERRELCSGYNVLAYNPDVNYVPWSGLDDAGNAFANQAVTAARRNPYNAGGGTRTVLNDYYFVFQDDGDGVYENNECPIASGDRVYVNTLSAALQTNYANWYSYYRKREYVAKAAYGSVVVDATESRMGMMTLNRNNNVHMPVKSMNVDSTTGNKRALMDKLYTINSSSGTPLQNAMYRAGEYLSGGDASWIQAGSSGGQVFSDPRLSLADGGVCQQNFSIVMTDGYYNGTFNFGVGNTDTDGAGQWDGGLYADGFSNTLGDIAMKYYEDDLNVLPAGVPTNIADLNTEQHVVTYTVAFGVDGTLRCSPGETLDSKGNACPSPFPGWPENNSNSRRIDDLRHAAYNGRGVFLSADNPQTLVSSINEAINNIVSRTSSSAGVAFNSTNIQSDTLVFQGRYSTADWTGDLRFLPITAGGAVGSTIVSSGDELKPDVTPPASRVILTVNDATGVGIPFAWASLSTTPTSGQQALLGNQDIFNYLRGDNTCEVGNALVCVSGNKNLRARSTALGDIIHSGAAYVATPEHFYNFDNYDAFKTANSNRNPMVYVGANDGMLHGFDAKLNNGAAIANATGRERLAFVPGVFYDKLANLSSTTYNHEYFVDGTPTIGDAYFGAAWHTMLVSGLGAGGQSVFALDVTDPTAFSEANAASLVRWEFTDSDDADLGYTFSEPSIVKMKNGKFAAIFGNGLNSTENDGAASTTGEAVLFIIDLETGTVLSKISTTGYGSVADPNGLSTPKVVDVDGDFIADFAYAGDLHGNMWRFDLTDADPSNWGVSFTGKPLFTSVSATAAPLDRQAITSKPVFDYRATNDGYMVYFGTGKYLELLDNDITNQPTQTVYGIWDRWTKAETDASFTAFDRSKLVAQSILEETNVNSTDVRVTSDNDADWTTDYGWYMDLTVSPLGNQGERIISSPLVSDGKLFFTTLIPSAAICSSGGTGWLMVLDSTDGGRLPTSPFDANGDGIFNIEDLVTSTLAGGSNIALSGVKSKAGIISEAALIGATGGATDFIGLSNSSGTIGLGDVFPATTGGGGTTPPPSSGTSGSLIKASKVRPIGRVLWQQLK